MEFEYLIVYRSKRNPPTFKNIAVAMNTLCVGVESDRDFTERDYKQVEYMFFPSSSDVHNTIMYLKQLARHWWSETYYHPEKETGPDIIESPKL